MPDKGKLATIKQLSTIDEREDLDTNTNINLKETEPPKKNIYPIPH